jgi:hypothetical protein
MTQRGVLYIAWETDDATRATLLDRAVASLRTVHPELPYHIARLPGAAPHIEKAALRALTPFDVTAYLDADTVVLGRLDFAFAMAEHYGLACCHDANPWRRRYVGVVGDAVEYDTGVLFFGAGASMLFELWPRLAPVLDARVASVEGGQAKQAPRDDQLAFGRAVEQSSIVPLVLHHNWNLRPRWQPSFFGPVKIWHDGADVPDAVHDICRYYEDPAAVIQFHFLGEPGHGPASVALNRKAGA